MTTPTHRLVSEHWFRRTARFHERRLQRQNPGIEYVVMKAKRGPYLWWLCRRTNNTPTR